MTITLYKNCILNDKYQNVFSNGSLPGDFTALDGYLYTLSSFSFTNNSIYYENEGELVFDLTLFPENSATSIYAYNYMKIDFRDESYIYHSEKRYCFINSISVKNGCVYVSYKEDVWASYERNIAGILPSYLTNSRIKQYENLTPALIKLPEKYDGDKKLDLIYQSDTNAYCIVELQVFLLTSAERVGTRYTYYCALSNYSGNTFKFTKTDLWNRLRFTFSISASQTLKCRIPYLNQEGTYIADLNFSIGDVYILPETFDINKLIDKSEYFAKFEYEQHQVDKYPTFYKLKETLFNSYNNIYQGIIQNDYKNLSFGTFCSQINIENNGNDIPFQIDFAYDPSNVSIRMNVQNQMFDITEDYKCNFPFTPITADGYAQRKIALAINNANLDASAFKAGLGLGNAAHGTGISWGQNLLNFAEDQRLSLSGLQMSSNYTAYGLGAIADIYRIGKTKELINKPIYSSAQANWGNHKEMVNYYVPYVITRINPSNQNYIKNVINNFGYRVYEFINDWSILQIDNPYYWQSLDNPINYNVIKFETANVYGSFTNEIAEKLNSILENGVKIWFNINMMDDNYVV